MDEKVILQSRRASKFYFPVWLIITIAALAILNGLPFLAPVFMKLGWDSAGRAIYLVYSGLCHQMAQRSFFLFGPQGFQMYSLSQLPIANSSDSIILASRFFLGNPTLGWKVAWSDRMVSMYLSPLLVALVYAVLRRWRVIKPLPLWAAGLLLVPMVVDGVTHTISDFAGISQGFRDSNVWLANLTGNTFPTWFYAGDALGSFNSWMRLFSGLTFGIAAGGLIYPTIDLTLPLTPTTLPEDSQLWLPESNPQPAGDHPRYMPPDSIL
jgi:uncharacterized membrane protein